MALVRIPAVDQAHKLGPLLVNLGGPTATLGWFRQSAAKFAELTQWFDVIAFDPRGFGESTGVTCPTSPPDLLFLAADPAGRWAEQTRQGQRYDRTCRDVMGNLAGRLDSGQVAHDMDAIRQALGQRTLSYYGNSYGTVYGQAYLELFPHRVNRMYLDSVLDHTTVAPYDRYAVTAAVVRDRLPGVTEWCSAHPECALHGQDVLAVWDRVLAKASRAPIPALGTDWVMTAGELRARSGAMSEASAPHFTAALAKADAGDAIGFHAIPEQTPPDLSFHAYCADFPALRRQEALPLMAELKKIEPRVGWLHPATVQGRCLGLPAPSNPPHDLRVPAALPPVLLANGLHDVATTPSMGQHVAAQLPGARWLGVDGQHALYFTGDNRCLRDHVHRYLTTGALPAADTICPAES